MAMLTRFPHLWTLPALALTGLLAACGGSDGVTSSYSGGSGAQGGAAAGGRDRSCFGERRDQWDRRSWR
jgi:hypothetical protein